LPVATFSVLAAFALERLRKGPFGGPATVKLPALPEDNYFIFKLVFQTKVPHES
jgi:hypothetical protein